MQQFFESWHKTGGRPVVLVVGNRKGGSGKSTIAIHVIVGLQAHGMRIGSIDLDGGQGTLSHFLENRRRERDRGSPWLPCPEHRSVSVDPYDRSESAEEEGLSAFCAALEQLGNEDVVVVDTPGNDALLARAAHIMADVLITPLNSSFLDLDILVRLDAATNRIVGSSVYSELVLYMSEQRVALGVAPIDWIVLGNRLPNVETRNQNAVSDILDELSARLGFRMAPGLHERVVYRELFPQGLTVLDIDRPNRFTGRGRRCLEARKEIAGLLATLNDVTTLERTARTSVRRRKASA